jgi:Tfp pilus assembly protein PilN
MVKFVKNVGYPVFNFMPWRLQARSRAQRIVGMRLLLAVWLAFGMTGIFHVLMASQWRALKAQATVITQAIHTLQPAMQHVDKTLHTYSTLKSQYDLYHVLYQEQHNLLIILKNLAKDMPSDAHLSKITFQDNLNILGEAVQGYSITQWFERLSKVFVSAQLNSLSADEQGKMHFDITLSLNRHSA